LTANQQLIDFHFNRVLLNKNKKKKGVNDSITEQAVEESARKEVPTDAVANTDT